MVEMKKIFNNAIFWVGTAVLTITFFLSGQVYMEQLIDIYAGYSEKKGILWFEVFQYCITSENGLLFIPICTPLVASTHAEMELRSRYALFYCNRIGKRRYYLKKLAECIIPGGLMVIFSELIVVLLVYLKMSGISEKLGENDIRNMLVITLIILIQGFLNGIFWAGVGGVSAVVTKNLYAAYAIPFVLYYVLTVFQERFYQSLFFFSPKYWGASLYYGEGSYWSILPGMCIICVSCFMLAIKRRIRNV